MKGFLVFTTTVAFLGMFAATTSAQKVIGVGTTPGYSNSKSTTPGVNNANRPYDAPRVDNRTPAPNSNGGRNDRNWTYKDDRDSRYGHGSESNQRRGDYGSRNDDRRRYDHRDNDRNCSCDKCQHHNDKYGSKGKSSEYRNRGYVDYRDRDRGHDHHEKSKGSCAPKGKGKYGRG